MTFDPKRVIQDWTFAGLTALLALSLCVVWRLYRRQGSGLSASGGGRSPLLLRLLELVAGLGALALFASGAWIIWLGVSEMNAQRFDNGLKCLGAAAGLLLLANVERFENFSIFGLSGKMRALDESLDKARASVAQLNDLAEASAQGVIAALTSTFEILKAQPVDRLDLRTMNAAALREGLNKSANHAVRRCV